MRCSSHCTANSLDLEALSKDLSAREITWNSHRGVVQAFSEQGAEVFCFSYGVVVFWGASELFEQQWLEMLRTFERERLAQSERDIFAFEGGQTPRFLSDKITLPTGRPLAKLAASYGLAQSVKLAAFESSVEKTLQRCQPIAKRLAKKGRIFLSRREIARRMGQLFLERSSICVYLDILDKPEIVWEVETAEPYYDLVADYLDLSARQTVLNRRLDIVKEIFDMLSSQLNHQHSATLEWIIILLILFDMVLSLMRDFHLMPFSLSQSRGP